MEIFNISIDLWQVEIIKYGTVQAAFPLLIWENWNAAFFVLRYEDRTCNYPVPLGREILPVVQGTLFFMRYLSMMGFGYR